MYRAEPDPYRYPGSSILKNKAGLIGEVELEEFESAMTFARANEPLPSGRLSVSHYRAVHHHFFQDVYIWAGKYRTVRLTKGESTFCYPEHIAQEMQKLFSWLKAEQFLKQQSPSAFAEGAAHFISELNAIHPFREGNGRTQFTFLALLSEHGGHPLDLDRLDADAALDAMIRSFNGDETALRALIEGMIAQRE